MQFSFAELAQATIASPVGRIDQAHADAFSAALDPLLDVEGRADKPLVLDFAGVDYISSIGLRALMVAHRKLQPEKGRIAIINLQPLVREVFSISRFDLLIPCYADLEAALQAL
jgi:anti-anti-sigma factor